MNYKEFFDNTDKEVYASILLPDVLAQEGVHPSKQGRNDDNRLEYVCPFHDDKNPSFHVYKEPLPGHSLPHWECRSCGASGNGAIELQMALLRRSEPQMEKSDLWYLAMCTLASRFNLPNNGGKHFLNDIWHRSTEVGPAEGTGRNYVSTPKANLSWEDIKTIGRDWPTETIDDEDRLEEIATVLRDELYMQPISSCQYNTKDGKRMEEISTATYPIFEFRYPSGAVKKYEPMARRVLDADGKERPSYKFTWWNTEGKKLKDAIYGDKEVITRLNLPKSHSEETEGDRENVRKLPYLVICSGPHDAINIYMHYRLLKKNVHVVYPHTEKSLISDSVIERLLGIAEKVCVCYDIDHTGVENQKRICLRNLPLCPIDLPVSLTTYRSGRTGKSCKDVSEFLTYYQREGRKGPYLFHQMIRKAKPLKFWKTTIHRHRIGKNPDDILLEERYELDPTSTCLFLQYKGFHAVQTLDPKRKIEKVGGYCIIGPYQDDMVTLLPNQVEVIPSDMGMNRARDIMRNFLYDYPLSDSEADELINTISTQRKFTSEALQQGAHRTHLNFDYWNVNTTEASNYCEYFFYRNTAVRITQSSIEDIPYDRLSFHVNKAAVIDADFHSLSDDERSKSMPSVILNPEVLEREAEYEKMMAMRTSSPDERKIRTRQYTEWRRLWGFLLKMPDTPFKTLSPVVQWAKRIGEIYWAKYEQGYTLSPDETQRQNMLTIIAMSAIGFSLVRRRTKGMVHFVLFTDYAVSDTEKESGGTGKSTVLDLIRMCSPVCHIIGQTFKRKENFSRNFDKFVDSVDRVIGVDDIRAEVDGSEFNGVTEGLDVKNLYHDEMRIPFENCPKFIISTNKLKFDATKDSTYRRMFPVMISNYFHPANIEGFRRARNYRSEWGKDIIKEATREEARHIRHFIHLCVQTFMQMHDVLGDDAPMIPLDDAIMSRISEASDTKDKPFSNQAFREWMRGFLEDNDNYHRPISVTEMQIEYWRTTDKAGDTDPLVSHVTTCKRQFVDAVKDYCDKAGIVIPKWVGIDKVSRAKSKNVSLIVNAWEHQTVGPQSSPSFALSLPRVCKCTPCMWFYNPDDQIPFECPGGIGVRAGEAECAESHE